MRIAGLDPELMAKSMLLQTGYFMLMSAKLVKTKNFMRSGVFFLMRLQQNLDKVLFRRA